MSLIGKRVLVTRSRAQASELSAQLEAMGAEVIQIPTIEIGPPSSFCSLDAALACLRSFDWVVFTSANAVQLFAERARRVGVAAAPKRIAVVGPATAKAVNGIDQVVDLMPETYVAEALGQAMMPVAPGAAILLVRAEVAPDVLPKMLRAAGAEVTVVSAYRTIVPEESLSKLKELFSARAIWPDAITFTSASTVTNLLALLGLGGLTLPNDIARISIGPVTTRALCEADLEPHGEAVEVTLQSLCATVEQCVAKR